MYVQKNLMPVTAIMGLINNCRNGALLALALLLAPGNGLYAQNPGAVVSRRLGMEIQELERRLSAGISTAERHESLTRLARLRQLSGDLAGAAANWLEAIRVSPSDDAARTAGAFCLAAIGEWEQSLLTIHPLLVSGRRGVPIMQARYLDAMLRTRMTNNAAPLTALVNDPELAAMRPLLYYTLWQLSPSGGETWRSRLLSEFPHSPEARAANPSSSASISAIQSPLWMLSPGVGGTNPVPAPPPPSITPNSAVGGAVGVVLQTGVFSSEANARAQVNALHRAGFTAVISRRQANSTDQWVVTVNAGNNATRTAQELRNAGFESFPKQ